jgi:hypothetical protein
MVKKLMFLIWLPLYFSSCVSVSTIEIQVLEPASHPITPRVENALLINRTFIDEPESLSDTLPGKIPVETFNQSTTELIFALADILNESPGIAIIDSTRILEAPGSVPGVIPEVFDADFIRFICDSLDASAVIAIEDFNIRIPDTILVTSETDRTRLEYYYVGELNVVISALWRVYFMPAGIISEEFNWSDTLTWHRAAYNTFEIARQMPPRKEISMEAAYFTALNYARRISPYWLTEQRNFFSRGNPALRNAAFHMQQGQFGDAKAEYELLLEKRNKNVAAAAAFNLSLVYEIEGNYRLAHNWARKSYQYRSHPVTSGYIDILEERIGKSTELDRQLGRIP